MGWRDWLRFLKAVAKSFLSARITGAPAPFSFEEKVGDKTLIIQGEVRLLKEGVEVPNNASGDIRHALAEVEKEEGNPGLLMG